MSVNSELYTVCSISWNCEAVRCILSSLCCILRSVISMSTSPRARVVPRLARTRSQRPARGVADRRQRDVEQRAQPAGWLQRRAACRGCPSRPAGATDARQYAGRRLYCRLYCPPPGPRLLRRRSAHAVPQPQRLPPHPMPGLTLQVCHRAAPGVQLQAQRLQPPHALRDRAVGHHPLLDGLDNLHVQPLARLLRCCGQALHLHVAADHGGLGLAGHRHAVVALLVDAGQRRQHDGAEVCEGAVDVALPLAELLLHDLEVAREDGGLAEHGLIPGVARHFEVLLERQAPLLLGGLADEPPVQAAGHAGRLHAVLRRGPARALLLRCCSRPLLRLARCSPGAAGGCRAWGMQCAAVGAGLAQLLGLLAARHCREAAGVERARVRARRCLFWWVDCVVCRGCERPLGTHAGGCVCAEQLGCIKQPHTRRPVPESKRGE
jgi:hypothetical protein